MKQRSQYSRFDTHWLLDFRFGICKCQVLCLQILAAMNDVEELPNVKPEDAAAIMIGLADITEQIVTLRTEASNVAARALDDSNAQGIVLDTMPPYALMLSMLEVRKTREETAAAAASAARTAAEKTAAGAAAVAAVERRQLQQRRSEQWQRRQLGRQQLVERQHLH